MVAAKIRDFERATRLEHALSAAGTVLDRAEARVRAHRAAETDRDAARDAFTQSLQGVYRDPAAARALITAAVARNGAPDAIRRLRDRPEAYGALRGVEQGRGVLGRFGLGKAHDVSAAREAAVHAATRADRMVVVERAVPSGSERDAARAGVAGAQARYDLLRGAAEPLPLRSRLAANLARGMDRLSDQNWAALRSTLTARQAVIGDVVREAGRDDRMPGLGRTSAPAAVSPTARHARSRLAGTAMHHAMTHLAPRELRQIARAIEAVQNPALALKRAVTQQVRDAVLGLNERER